MRVLHDYALYKSTFYLLTYLLIYLTDHATASTKKKSCPIHYVDSIPAFSLVRSDGSVLHPALHQPQQLVASIHHIDGRRPRCHQVVQLFLHVVTEFRH